MNKKKVKKLSLTPETLRNLDAPDLKQADGGAPTDFCTEICTEVSRRCSVCCP